MNEPITRRKALVAAGAVGAAAALTGVHSVHAASGGGGHAVTGTWVITVTSARGGTPFTSLVAFAAGGSLVTIDSNGPGNVSLGAWEPVGDSGFRAVFDSFSFDKTGAFVGTAIIHPRGEVDGNRIHGTYEVDFRGAAGPSQQDVDTGTFAGSRLEP